MQVAANVLACSAIDLFKNPEILKEAQKELADTLGGRKYKPLLPDGTAPPININEKTMDKYRSLMAEFYKSNPAAK
jgi:aminobenzoyl-glutamate utilization protein B